MRGATQEVLTGWLERLNRLPPTWPHPPEGRLGEVVQLCAQDTEERFCACTDLSALNKIRLWFS